MGMALCSFVLYAEQAGLSISWLSLWLGGNHQVTQHLQGDVMHGLDRPLRVFDFKLRPQWEMIRDQRGLPRPEAAHQGTVLFFPSVWQLSLELREVLECWVSGILPVILIPVDVLE